MTDQQLQIIDDYFASILQRFSNMKDANIDELGLTKAIKMVEGYLSTKTITPGEFQYIYDRTHPKGEFPKYNTKGKRHGLMNECPVQILTEHIVDWRIPHNQLKHTLQNNHDDFMDWYLNSNNHKRPLNTTKFSDLFTFSNTNDK